MKVKNYKITAQTTVARLVQTLVIYISVMGLLFAASVPIANLTLQTNLNGNGFALTNITSVTAQKFYGDATSSDASAYSTNAGFSTNAAFATNAGSATSSGYLNAIQDANMNGLAIRNAGSITATNTVTAPLFENNQLSTNDVIICLGDSVTLGNGSSTAGGDYHTGYPGQLSALVPGIKVYSYGVGGAPAGPVTYSGSGMAQLAATSPMGYEYLNGAFVSNTTGAVSTEVSTSGTTYWIISFGINDAFIEGGTNFQTYLESLIASARSYGTSNNKVILSTVLPSSSFNRSSAYQSMTEIVAATVGSSYNSSYADAVNDWASLLNNSSANLATVFRTNDGIHPNDRGYQMLAQKTLQTLRTLPVLPTATGFVTRGIGLTDEGNQIAITTSTNTSNGGRALWNSLALALGSSLNYDAGNYVDPLSGNGQYGVQINDEYGGHVMTFPDGNAVTPAWQDNGNYWSVYGSYSTTSLKMKANGTGANSGTNVNLEFVPRGSGQVLLDGGATATGNVASDSLGAGFQTKEGANAKQGVATLSGGTVTISDSSVTAISRIFLAIQSLGTVTTPATLAVTARTAGTSFTVTSSASNDTSTFAYEIFEPAP